MRFDLATFVAAHGLVNRLRCANVYERRLLLDSDTTTIHGKQDNNLVVKR